MEFTTITGLQPWQLLRNLQLGPSSCEDCTLKCDATISPNGVLRKWFEIPIHSCLFREQRWLHEDNTNLPGEMFIDLHRWTLKEIAPIVDILYSPREPTVNLNPRSKQALEAIQSYLSEKGLDIVIPEMDTVSTPPLQRQPLEKFKCLEVQQADRQSFHYIISTGELICKFYDAKGLKITSCLMEISLMWLYICMIICCCSDYVCVLDVTPCCKHCTFSGLNEELQEHMRATHGGTVDLSVFSTLIVE